MRPAAALFFATAFLWGMSSCPTSVATADSALATILENAKTATTAVEDRVRVAALAWEHECATADALACQVAEAEHFLHTSTGEHVASSRQLSPTIVPTPSARPLRGTDDPMVAYLHLQAAEVPHIKNLVTVLLDSTSTSYTRWRDQVLLALSRYVLFDTPARARDPAWWRRNSIAVS
jgi:hypothetical protein